MGEYILSIQTSGTGDGPKTVTTAGTPMWSGYAIVCPRNPASPGACLHVSTQPPPPPPKERAGGGETIVPFGGKGKSCRLASSSLILNAQKGSLKTWLD